MIRFSVGEEGSGALMGFVSGVPYDWKHQLTPCPDRPYTYVIPSMSVFHAAMKQAEARGATVEAPSPAFLKYLETRNEGRGGDPVSWERLGPGALTVKPHQRDAVNRIVEVLGGRAGLLFPMGTGKTPTALWTAAHYGPPVLVIASAQEQWAEECEKFTEFPTANLIKGSSGEIDDEGVTIITYQSVGLREDVRDHKWRCIIVDESHTLGGDCDQNRAIVKMCEKARCVLCLSGTPVAGRPRELFNTLRCILPKVFTNRKAYEKRYCDGKIGRFGYEARGVTNATELSALVNHVCLTCDKTAVLPDLPPISYTDVRLDMPSDVVKEFDEMQKQQAELTAAADAAPPEMREGIKSKLQQLITKMHMRTGEVKTPFCITWLLDLIAKKEDPTEKILVFCHHKSVVRATCEALGKSGITNVRIDGDMSRKKRHENIKIIRNPLNPAARVAVLTLATGAASFNICPGATVVVMFQMSFKPSDSVQAYGRAWRHGATRPVEVYTLLANHTYDDAVLRNHAAKTKMADEIFRNKRHKSGWDST